MKYEVTLYLGDLQDTYRESIAITHINVYIEPLHIICNINAPIVISLHSLRQTQNTAHQ